MNKIEMLMLAVAAITVLIGLGQLIIAFSQIGTSRNTEKRRPRQSRFMWFLIALQGVIGAIGVVYFDRYVEVPSKLDLYGFGVSIFSVSCAYAVAMARLVFMRHTKNMLALSRQIIELGLKVERMERTIADELPSFR
ncbi:hypothetical protein [Eoetvoesiella caeni]|uniref:Uncharacterized protein n=1 Tax=Eoetvoesiella caeni TaxID=645616 RepID=A0A366H0U7_9BURK|nr:hypothetical protein [Eoetvoesiella caeni]MCI2811151.1 hypothetical protein [Eoetvoesiella caeni]NYT57212.1 hypothetical protein [Eoetvoesiella caeni]RBP35117.1 hypothetical protein DFR37_12045 [Eoetvoesiella caeni]